MWVPGWPVTWSVSLDPFTSARTNRARGHDAQLGDAMTCATTIRALGVRLTAPSGARSPRRLSARAPSTRRWISVDRIGACRGGSSARAARAETRAERRSRRSGVVARATPADDEPVVGKSAFDFDAEMMADMERLKADSPLAKEAAAAAAAGTAVKSDSQLRMEAIKDGIDTFLLYDFFVILAILTWLIVGVVVRLSHGQGLSYNEPFLGAWLFLWPWLFQPLLGIHMLATIVSPIIGKLKDRGLVSKDTWT